MSNILTDFLSGFVGSDGYLKDQQHARALYRDDNIYDLAPKAGWIYYVRLGINPAIRDKLDSTWASRFSSFVGLLAKSAELPKFKMTTEAVNQYNRKTVVQTKLNYEPITLTFHDDMANATTWLWKNYYEYYFADGRVGIPTAVKLGKSNSAFRDTKYSDVANDYGLANGQDEPFFTSIDIYLLNKQRYTSVTLLNPIITEWQHGSVGQTEGSKMLDSRMTIAYESVVYGRGRAHQAGFTTDHYDNSPSPLVIGGNGGNSLFGPGGVVPGISDLLGDFGDVNKNTDPLALVGLGLRAANLAKNVSKLTSAQIKQEGYSILQGQLGNLGRVGIGGYFSGLASTNLGTQVTGLVTNIFSDPTNTSVNPLIQAGSGTVPANAVPFLTPTSVIIPRTPGVPGVNQQPSA